MKTLADYRNEAIRLRSKTFETVIVCMVSCYDINDERFEEGIIECLERESDAEELVSDMKTEQDCEVYYKPVLVDQNDYTIVTEKNMYYYDNNSEFVKNLKAELSV